MTSWKHWTDRLHEVAEAHRADWHHNLRSPDPQPAAVWVGGMPKVALTPTQLQEVQDRQTVKDAQVCLGDLEHDGDSFLTNTLKDLISVCVRRMEPDE